MTAPVAMADNVCTPVEPSPAEAERAIYDGRHQIGSITTDGHGKWRAFGIDGRQLGDVHPSPPAATDAVIASWARAK